METLLNISLNTPSEILQRNSPRMPSGYSLRDSSGNSFQDSFGNSFWNSPKYYFWDSSMKFFWFFFWISLWILPDFSGIFFWDYSMNTSRISSAKPPSLTIEFNSDSIWNAFKIFFSWIPNSHWNFSKGFSWNFFWDSTEIYQLNSQEILKVYLQAIFKNFLMFFFSVVFPEFFRISLGC